MAGHAAPMGRLVALSWLGAWVAACALPLVPLSADSGFVPERALSADSATSLPSQAGGLTESSQGSKRSADPPKRSPSPAHPGRGARAVRHAIDDSLVAFDLCHPWRGEVRLGILFPEVSLRSTPGYYLATLRVAPRTPRKPRPSPFAPCRPPPPPLPAPRPSPLAPRHHPPPSPQTHVPTQVSTTSRTALE